MPQSPLDVFSQWLLPSGSGTRDFAHHTKIYASVSLTRQRANKDCIVSDFVASVKEPVSYPVKKTGVLTVTKGIE